MSKPFLIGSFTTLDVRDICFDSDLGLYLAGSFTFTSHKGDSTSSDRLYITAVGNMFMLSLRVWDGYLLSVNPFVTPEEISVMKKNKKI